jgi:hypothetical protein
VAQSKSSSVYRTLKRLASPLVSKPFGGAILSFMAQTNLDGTNDGRLVVDTPTFATRAPSYKRLIDLDRILSANGITVRSHHSGT